MNEQDLINEIREDAAAALWRMRIKDERIADLKDEMLRLLYALDFEQGARGEEHERVKTASQYLGLIEQAENVTVAHELASRALSEMQVIEVEEEMEAKMGLPQDLVNEIRRKDKRIAELEAELDGYREHFVVVDQVALHPDDDPDRHDLPF